MICGTLYNIHVLTILYVHFSSNAHSHIHVQQAQLSISDVYLMVSYIKPKVSDMPNTNCGTESSYIQNLFIV